MHIYAGTHFVSGGCSLTQVQLEIFFTSVHLKIAGADYEDLESSLFSLLLELVLSDIIHLQSGRIPEYPAKHSTSHNTAQTFFPSTLQTKPKRQNPAPLQKP